MPRILVLGSGFAGLWAAVGGARKLAELGIPRGQVEILVVERNPYHGIRVRNYEPDLSNVAIPLAEVLDPIGVKHLTAEVEAIDVARQQVVAAAKALSAHQLPRRSASAQRRRSASVVTHRDVYAVTTHL